MRRKILAITPIKHISGLVENLGKIGDLVCLEDPTKEDILPLISAFDAIFTNPNKSKVYLDKTLLNRAVNLKVICTASTGTNHINRDHAEDLGIEIISLTEEREIIEKISSTAEHAFALTLSSIRNIPSAHRSVLGGEWDYEKFIGRQMDQLTVGVIGYGRLGRKYAKYCSDLGSRVIVFDPYKTIAQTKIEQVQYLENIFSVADIVSIHVHINSETHGLVDKSVLEVAKKDLLIVNTSRGEVINEVDLVVFLRENENAKVAADVLSNEISDRLNSPLYRYSKHSSQVILTPHIGGMTKEAQEIAYNHAANMLNDYLVKVS